MTDAIRLPRSLFTIGHSNHELDQFLSLIQRHRISAVADVRSEPRSAFSPHFNAAPLKEALRLNGIRYVPLGEELGARRKEQECYVDDRVKFDLVARLPAFQQGLDRIRLGLARNYRIVLMCAEKDPLACHRTILICRHLREDPILIQHILEDGTLEPHDHAELRLLHLLRLPQSDLLSGKSELIEQAYQQQADRIAYSNAMEPDIRRARDYG